MLVLLCKQVLTASVTGARRAAVESLVIVEAIERTEERLALTTNQDVGVVRAYHAPARVGRCGRRREGACQ